MFFDAKSKLKPKRFASKFHDYEHFYKSIIPID